MVEGAPYPEYGTKMNVWQIGQCMYELIMRGRDPDWNQVWRVDMTVNGERRNLDFFGIEAKNHPAYSATLRKLLMRCLAVDATDRPTPDEMLEICEGAIAVVRQVEEEDGIVEVGLIQHQFWEDGLIERIRAGENA